MPISIDEFSTKPLYLDIYLNDEQLGVATGFVIKRDKNYYLITNWHVVSGKKPSSNQSLSPENKVPNKLKVWFHGQKLGSWVPRDIFLTDSKGNSLWLEHKRGREIDVVVVPITKFKDTKIYEIDLLLADFDLMIYPSEPVSIIGFPLGITSAGKLPIWKTGNIASDIDIDWGGKPAFLIDATTKSGMSGSPVIAKRVSIYQTSTGNKIGNAVKFLGVYSGREVDENGIEIGYVWKPKVIHEILDEYQSA